MAKKRKITTLRLLLGVISVFIGALILAFLTEMLADDIEELLIQYWGEKNHLFYLICILGASLVLLLLTYLLENSESAQDEKTDRVNLREEFLKNLKQLYEKRLNDKMLGEMNFEIKLNLKYTTRGNQPETIEDFFVIKNETQTGDFNRLFKNFKENLWRLLILGEPGAGKSILLLRFGLKLIELAENDPDFPIPILLDLASWKDKNQTFEGWLEMNLPYVGGSFAISKEDAKMLVESKNILLLLDGFDEINWSYRDSCLQKLLPFLQKIKNARKESYPELIICSRILEYEAAEDAPVFASVKIQPLSEKEVSKALKPLTENKKFPAARRLQSALTEKPSLYSAITSAFFMHTLLNISQQARPEFMSASKESLQEEITEFYIASELGKVSGFKKEKVKKWLGWLAWKMKYLEGNIAFELIDLQPWWAKGKYVYSLFFGLFFGLIYGIVALLLFGVISNTLSNYDLVLVLLFGITLSIISGLVVGQMDAEDLDELNLKRLITKIRKRSLFGGPSAGQIRTQEIKVLDFKRVSWNLIKESLGEIMIFGLIGAFIGFIFGNELFLFVGGLGFGFFLSIVNRLSFNASFPKVTNPYKRFLAQFWRDFFQYCFLIIFIIVLAFSFSINSNMGFQYGFAFMILLSAFASVFVSPIFQHICLRLVLYLEKVIPLNLVVLLDAVSKTGLMIKDGGKWRFRHQLIHDNLADWFEANHLELLRKNDLKQLNEIRAKEKNDMLVEPE